MLGIGAAAFWLPALRIRDDGVPVTQPTPAQTAVLRALARRECGLLLPIQGGFAEALPGFWWVGCRAPFGFSRSGFLTDGTGVIRSELAPRLGIAPWAAFLLLEGAWGALLYRASRAH